ncbi:hypothetical protein P154DRAFT_579816 [Amniculicola lignicola CBS 123094]|uniref:Fungal N-terminal domain-containing protein n=1 Tax=Amniculicola lignicola CBS 123094 TaxID=1392246 RepID=A0A6A5W5J5_9PLEO|nr:hypothetical protein P154DRAFT_579816 [Amniculicola lignicola CBS 123094]
MDPIGSVLNIAHILKRAYQLYTGCNDAPEEIRLASDHIHGMTLVLEGVHTDLIANPRSFVHQTSAQAKTRTANLKVHLNHCDGALKRMGKLLSKYQGWKRDGHVKMWDKFKWTTEGRKDIADAKVDIILATSMLDVFLSREALSVLWKIESMIEMLTRNFQKLELFQGTGPTQGTKRSRAGSNVTRTLVVGLVIARLKTSLANYRRRKLLRGGKKGGTTKPNPGPRRPKPISRVSSGFGQNKRRDTLMHSYASNLVSASNSRPRPERARTPSPDFYMIGGDPAPPYSPVRRSSSLNRILNQINAKAKQPTSPREYLECWRVGVGSLAIGLNTAPQFLQHRRGQVQLRKMASIFKDAAAGNPRALDERDKRVKLILDHRNGREKKKKSGKKWSLLAGVVVGRDAGRSGMVSVEKAMVIVVRR